MEYLSQSAYPNGFEFDLKLLPASGYQTAAELVQAYLSLANIKVNIINQEFVAYFDMLAAYDFTAFMAGVASSLVLATYYMGLITADNVAMFPELEGYINTANSTFDAEERYDALMNMQKFIDEHALMQGITGQIKFNMSKGVTGIVVDAQGFIIPHFVQPA